MDFKEVYSALKLLSVKNNNILKKDDTINTISQLIQQKFSSNSLKLKNSIIKILAQIFDKFTSRGSDLITLDQILGISILCNGSIKDKWKYAFSQKVTVSIYTLTRYFHSVFIVLLSINPNLIKNVIVGIIELARSTEMNCLAGHQTTKSISIIKFKECFK